MRVSKLYVSVALNAVLVAAVGLLAWRVQSPAAPPALPASPKPVVRADAQQSAAQVRIVFDKLMQCGFEEAQAKQLTLAALPQPSGATEQYWRPAMIKQLSEQSQNAEVRRIQQEAIVSAFGSAATSDPAFAQIFFPNRSRWPYLRAEQQLALDALLSEERETRLARISAQGFAGVGRAESDIEKIKGLLGEEAAREFEIRESGAANSLRNIGFDFSEREFRRVYEILSNASQDNAGAFAARLNPMMLTNDADPVTVKIREALGPERFAVYRKSQDPQYRVMMAAASMYGVQVDNVEKAYDLEMAAARKVAAIMKKGPVLSGESARELNEIRGAQTQKLTELLGPEAAQFVARSSVSFSGGMAAIPIGAPVMPRTPRDRARL